MAKRIITFGSLKTNAIRKTTNNTSFNIGICLSEAPSSNVTVSFASTLSKFTASASLTFTTSNWATPQTLTITAVNDSVVDIAITDTLTITAANGGYDGITKTMPVIVYDSVVWPFDLMFGYDYWTNNAHVVNSETSRLEALAFMFNNNGLPTGYSNLTLTAGYSGAMHVSINTSALTSVASVDRFVLTKLDDDAATWTNYVYHIKASTGGNTKLMVISLGNIGIDDYNTILAINTFLAAGVDVLFCGMPNTGGQNTDTSSVVTSTGSAGWNQMVSGGLDTPTYSPIELFFFDVAGSLNYIDANYPSYTQYSITGIHAGGWVALVYGALDPRIDKVFPIRGLNPLPLDNVAGPFPVGDNLAANGAKTYNFYLNNVSLIDYFIICSKQKYIKVLDNTRDATSGSATAKYWIPIFEDLYNCSIDSYVSTAVGTATAAYYADFLTEIISEL